MSKNYVIINGRAYNAITGMPMPEIVVPKETEQARESVAPKQRGVNVSAVHQAARKSSRTLNRRHVKTPVPASREIHLAHKKPAASTISMHESVQKFSAKKEAAKQPEHTMKKPSGRAYDRPAETHPVVHRAKNHHADITAKKRRVAGQITEIRPKKAHVEQHALKSAQHLKHEAITEALQREVAPQKRHKPAKQRSGFMRWTRLAAAGLGVMILAGYLTYLSMPNLSIRIAAVQSGVNAKYPSYAPNGYALRGPITFKDGEVSMKFAYTSGDKPSYTLTQQKSSWNADAVKQYVDSQSAQSTTTLVDGLKIYSYDNSAAWVNAGVLYTIDGSAPLSGEQIRKIATSL